MKAYKGFSSTPLWERVIGAIGFLLVCFTIVFLIWSAINKESGSPQIRFQVHDISFIEERYLVLLDVYNAGDLTAADLQLQAQLIDINGNDESAVARIEYLPARSTRRVGLYFDGDPNIGELQIRASGYQEP